MTPGWSAGWAGGGGGGHAGPAGRPAGAGHHHQPWRQHPGPRRHQGPGHPAGDRAAGECSTILTSIYIVRRYSQYSEHKKKLQLVCEGVPITKYSEFLCSSMPTQCHNWRTLLQAEHLGLVSHMSLTSQESRDTLDQDQELVTVSQTNKQVEETAVLPTQVSIILNATYMLIIVVTSS